MTKKEKMSKEISALLNFDWRGQWSNIFSHVGGNVTYKYVIYNFNVYINKLKM